MTTLLICPSERSAVPILSQPLPLANVPLLGQSLLEYWLSALALRDIKEVLVLAHDRAEFAYDMVNHGERWGLTAKVIDESRELTPAEAWLKYAAEINTAPPHDSIAVLDHFPGKPEFPLFSSYQDWFVGVREWMPFALTPDRVGVNEVRPQIWMGCHSHVSERARLHAPCWIGQHVFVGAGAVIGPGGILEEGTFVEPGAELVESWVGPDTFVGQFTRIANSLAWGSTLVNRETCSAVQVADPFMLCALRQRRRPRSAGWLNKLTEIYSRNKGEGVVLGKHILLHKEG